MGRRTLGGAAPRIGVLAGTLVYGVAMPCLIALLALLSPRLALFFIAVFSDLPSRAMDGILLPLLGFFLLPWTTLAYIVMWDLGTHQVAGFEWFIVGAAFLADVGAYGGSARSRRS